MTFTTQETGFVETDYWVFSLLCVTSCAGGLWYAYFSTKKEAIGNIKDYLLGGKEMSTFPVALSLIASYVSGVTILGTPAEIYNYGTQYWLVVVAVSVSCVIVIIVYLPVFCTLKLSSSYEYLELRFNRHVRAVASILFIMDEVLFLPMIVYVPALAFEQLTGFNVYAVGALMVVICGLYTALGGLRAVVWTDSVQTGIMFIGVVLVAVAGTFAVGGIDVVWSVSSESGRIDISNWNLSPYERQTGWGVVFGGIIYWTCFNSVNQTMVQRYIALPTKQKAVNAMIIFGVGAVVAISLCVWCGLAAWTAWVVEGCDPKGAPVITDRLLPAFVTYVSTVQKLRGLAGVFLAGVFGAGLSSLSAVLNACALVAVEDLMHGWLQIRLKPMIEGIIARVATAILAIISVAMLVVISQLGGVLGVATSFAAIAASATCGVFTLGMVCWWVGPKGAISGAVAGALVAGTISIGIQVAAAQGLRSPPMNFSYQCAVNASYSLDSKFLDHEKVFPLFRLSYHWIAPSGLFTTLLVGSLVGWFFDKRIDLKKDAELFTPLMWRFLPLEWHQHIGEARAAFDALRVAALSPETSAPSSPLILDRIDKVEMNGEPSL